MCVGWLLVGESVRFNAWSAFVLRGWSTTFANVGSCGIVYDPVDCNDRVNSVIMFGQWGQRVRRL